MRRVALALALIAGCGRIGFERLGEEIDADVAGDVLVTTCSTRLTLYPKVPAYIDAKASCESGGGWVVTIDELAENAVIQAMINEKTFIGYNDRGVAEGGYRWDGPPSMFVHWGGGQPDNGGGVQQEDCVKMDTDGFWYDEACSVGAQFVCECP